MIDKIISSSYTSLSIGAAVFMLTLAGNMNKANASVFVFTNQTAWENALSGASFETENFDGAASSFSGNSTGNLVGSLFAVDLIGGVNDPGPTGLTGTGFFQGEVDSSSLTTGDSLKLNFNTNSAITGFGILGLQNDSSQDTSGLDLEEIGIEVNGESFLVSDILGFTNSSDGNFVNQVENNAPIPFIGFTSDSEITSFSFLHGESILPGRVSDDQEEFYINGIITASTASTASESVPEPASILSLLALGAFGASSLKGKQ